MTIAMLSRSLLHCVFIAASLVSAGDAHAWGTAGHEAVALAAEQQLTPRARQKVGALLAMEPGATLASISNWADITRNRATAPWHYVNLPRDADCVYSAPRDCPDGNCIVAAVRAQARRLQESPSSVERLEALKYVVHFVADLHQPLHAAFADDRGGNDYQIQALGRGMTLHSLWDTWIVRQIGLESATLTPAIGDTRPQPVSGAFDPVIWATESCRIATESDFYPPRKVGEPYFVRYVPVAQMRLRLAAARLAKLINQLLND